MSVTNLADYRKRVRPRVEPGALDEAQAAANDAFDRGADLPKGMAFRLVIEIGSDGSVTKDWAVCREGGPYSPRTLEAAHAAVLAAQGEIGAAALADGLKARIVAVLAQVCERHGVTLAQLKRRRERAPHIVAARRDAVQSLMAIPGPKRTPGSQDRPALSLSRIGRILGGFSHASISKYAAGPRPANRRAAPVPQPRHAKWTPQDWAAAFAKAEAEFERICAAHGMPPARVRGKSRRREVVAVRREIARALNAIPGPAGKPAITLTRIGKMLGGRDHSTVFNLIHGKRRKGALS